MAKKKEKSLVPVATKNISDTFKEMGLEVLPDTDTHINRVNINSETSDRIYVVSTRVKKDGSLVNECGCPAWIYRRHCKHVDTMGPIFDEMNATVNVKKIEAMCKKEIEHVPTITKTVEKKSKVTGGPTPDDKDFQRIENILVKSGGDMDKMLAMCERMAKTITHPDKAQRRAVAAKQTLPKEIATKAYDIFWQD